MDEMNNISVENETRVSNDYLEENEFRLPVGFVDSEGRLHETIKLRPMTGETEEAIADPKVRDNGGKLVTELIFSVTERVGAVKKVNKDVIRQLTIADRDFVLLKNRQVSMGDDVNYVDQCPHCRGKNEVYVNLSNIKTKYLGKEDSREMTFDLVNGVRNSAGVMCKKITIQMPNGVVQERIAPIAKVNPAQATTAMLQLITKKIEGLDFLNPDVFKRMTKRDRDHVSKKLAEFEAGVEMASTVTCAECGAEFTSQIPMVSLLGE